MDREITWNKISEALEKNQDPYEVNEMLFAMLHGWEWPLYGAAEDDYERNTGSYAYLDNADIATEASIEMFRSFVWDKPEWEPEIILRRSTGHWLASIIIDAEHATAISDGNLNADVQHGGQDKRIGAAIMKAAIELRATLRAAKEPDETPAPE
ncbi:hypothetical protein ACGYLO_17805 [Sulfitobacter sp. 1A13353]|uniref:hypothetical protein n=1 Tax=Sulfitobacter sp. 1A13353 TaxID=3368568 RepID=UPI0037474F30